MKKVLIIFLILTVTSIANANVTWTITDDGAGEITVSVIDNPHTYLFLALAVDSYGVLSDFAAGLNAPEDSQPYGTLEDNYADWDLSSLGQGELWYMGDDYDPLEYNDGDWLTAKFEFASGSNPAKISLHMVDGSGTASFLTSHVMLVPEPASITLCLLGLGGLFRRRLK